MQYPGIRPVGGGTLLWSRLLRLDRARAWLRSEVLDQLRRSVGANTSCIALQTLAGAVYGQRGVAFRDCGFALACHAATPLAQGRRDFPRTGRGGNHQLFTFPRKLSHACMVETARYKGGLELGVLGRAAAWGGVAHAF